MATGLAGEALRSGGAFSVAPAVCLLLGAVALLGCSGSLISDRSGSRVVALGALAASSSALVAASADVGMLFLSVEMLALCGYGLVALGGTDRAREAAMKWFVQGSVATVVFVIGTALLLGRTGGSMRYDAIAKLAATSLDGPMAVGFVLVLSALAFKLGAFPLHSWMPDAYETAPPAAAAIMASAGKVGPIAATVWLSLAVTAASGERLIRVVAILAICSIVFGNLAALRQSSLARMLAYSGIAQVGYALVALPALASHVDAALPATMVFAVLYGTASSAAFLFVEAVRERDPDWDGSIAGLAGLRRRAPALAVSLAVVMFSLTGIPLTAGFWGKFLVFGSAASGGWTGLAVVGVLGSVVSFGYYGSVLRAAFLDDSSADPRQEQNAAGPASRATVGLAAVLVLLGVLPLLTGLGPLLGF
jgi:NADH-quinone oxidoreductase subunit N